MPNPREPLIPFSHRLPASLVEAVRAMAEAEDRKIVTVVERALRREVERAKSKGDK